MRVWPSVWLLVVLCSAATGLEDTTAKADPDVLQLLAWASTKIEASQRHHVPARHPTVDDVVAPSSLLQVEETQQLELAHAIVDSWYQSHSKAEGTPPPLDSDTPPLDKDTPPLDSDAPTTVAAADRAETETILLQMMEAVHSMRAERGKGIFSSLVSGISAGLFGASGVGVDECVGCVYILQRVMHELEPVNVKGRVVSPKKEKGVKSAYRGLIDQPPLLGTGLAMSEVVPAKGSGSGSGSEGGSEAEAFLEVNELRRALSRPNKGYPAMPADFYAANHPGRELPPAEPFASRSVANPVTPPVFGVVPSPTRARPRVHAPAASFLQTGSGSPTQAEIAAVTAPVEHEDVFGPGVNPDNGEFIRSQPRELTLEARRPKGDTGLVGGEIPNGNFTTMESAMAGPANVTWGSDDSEGSGSEAAKPCKGFFCRIKNKLKRKFFSGSKEEGSGDDSNSGCKGFLCRVKKFVRKVKKKYFSRSLDLSPTDMASALEGSGSGSGAASASASASSSASGQSASASASTSTKSIFLETGVAAARDTAGQQFAMRNQQGFPKLGGLMGAAMGALTKMAGFPLPHVCRPGKFVCRQRHRQEGKYDLYRRLRRSHMHAAHIRAMWSFAYVMNDLCSPPRPFAQPHPVDPASPQPPTPPAFAPMRSFGHLYQSSAYIRQRTRYGDVVAVGAFPDFHFAKVYRPLCAKMRPQLAVIADRYLHDYDDEEICTQLLYCKQKDTKTFAPSEPTDPVVRANPLLRPRPPTV